MIATATYNVNDDDDNNSNNKDNIVNDDAQHMLSAVVNNNNLTSSSVVKFQLKSPFENKLRHFTLYETEHRLYLVGCDVGKKYYKLLKIDKSDHTNHDTLNIVEDVGVYSCAQMNDIISMIKSSSKSNQRGGDASYSHNNNNNNNNNSASIGFTTRVHHAYGLVGFIKFTHGYYMILVTERKKVGNIASHFVYEIEKTELIPLFKTYSNVSSNGKKVFKRYLGFTKDDEEKYKEIFMGLDLSKDFYFSYTYDMTNPLQHNMTHNMKNESSTRGDYHKNMFEWNSFLMKPFKEQIRDDTWLLPIVHGHFIQSKLSVFGRIIDIVLVGRRSRYFAGTRYLKRGISDNGHVANHVETEQIVYDCNSLLNRQSQGAFSSIVQARGSIPLYWSQTIATKVVDPKPEIVMGKFDPLYTASAKHFEHLMDRYSYPICCFDLVKTKEKKPREQLLGDAYRNCVLYLNKSLPDHKKVKYTAWDFRRATKNKPEKALNELAAFAEENLEKTGFFCSRSMRAKEGYSLQKGVLRTNCIDCLDRTNIVQFFIGKYALGQQLFALGVTDSPHLVYYSNVVRVLMEMYDGMGDKIALQYGGSRTVSAGINHRGYSWDFFTSLKRYYSNNFKDETKQHAMNLFLGNYVPNSQTHLPPLWNLDTDSYLHDNDKSDICQLARDRTEPIELNDSKDQFFEEVYNQLTVTEFDEVSLLNSTFDLYPPKRKSKGISLPPSPRSQLSQPYVTEDQVISNTILRRDSQDIDVDDTIDSTSDHLFSEIETQGEMLRRFEGKMQNPCIVDPNLFHRDSFLNNHNNKMLQYQKENEKLLRIMSHDRKDVEIFDEYVAEASEGGWDSSKELIQRPFTRKQHIGDLFVTNHISYKSIMNRDVYSDYMGRFAPEKNIVRSELFTKDYALYKKYFALGTEETPESNDSAKKVEYGSLIEYDQLENAGEDEEEVEIQTNSYPNSHFQKLYPYFDSIKNNQKQLVKRIAFIITQMKQDMIVVDRVRHPRPAKKLFSHISLFEMLKGRLYRKCFLACRAIDWVLSKSGSDIYIEKQLETREEGREFLQILLEAHVFHHVAFARLFLDGHYLYKFSSDDPNRVLNMHQLQSKVSRRALAVSLDALAKITDIYRDMFNAEQRSTDYKVKTFFERLMERSRAVIGSSHYHKFLEIVLELQHVDLHLPRAERICFFLNIYNVLMLHSLLVMGGSSRSRLHGLATYSFYQRNCYQIAGYKFSLSDIRDGILRNNRSYPGSFTPVFNAPNELTPCTATDPRLRLCINPQDIRILFLLFRIDSVWNLEGSINIPKYMAPASTVYHDITTGSSSKLDSQLSFENIFSCIEPSTLEAVLKREAENFCLRNIYVDSRTNQVKLHSLFGVYCEDFGGSDEYVIQTCCSLLPRNCLLQSQLIDLFEIDTGTLKESIDHSSSSTVHRGLPTIGYI